MNLPDDVMLDICVRLPVKSVGRFRCVNKSLYKLLNGRKFVQQHLYHATEMNRLSFMINFVKGWRYQIHSIHYDPSLPACTGSVNTNLPHVGNNTDRSFGFHGYCNGLVCASPYNKNILCLWNPSTNEHKRLPETPRDTLIIGTDFENCRKIIQCGFGYDYKIGEFKVVCLNNYCRTETQVCGVHLYTLGSDTWITLESIPYIVCGQCDVAQEPVDGVLHWEAYRTFEGSKVRNRFILSFNFEKEIFQEMPWPDMLSKEFRTHLCVLGGSLCICSFNCNIGVEVWELKDCEGRKSWNKLFTVDMIKHFGLVTTIVPLQSLKNGEFLFGFDTDVGFRVHQYDPKHETTRPLFVFEDSIVYNPKHEKARPYFFGSSRNAVYVESLVSPNSGGNLDDDDDAQSDGVDQVEDDKRLENLMHFISLVPLLAEDSALSEPTSRNKENV